MAGDLEGPAEGPPAAENASHALVGCGKIVGMQLQPDPGVFRHRQHALHEVLVIAPHLLVGVGPIQGGRALAGFFQLKEAGLAAASGGGSGLIDAAGMPGVGGGVDSRPAQVLEKVLEGGDFLVPAR